MGSQERIRAAAKATNETDAASTGSARCSNTNGTGMHSRSTRIRMRCARTSPRPAKQSGEPKRSSAMRSGRRTKITTPSDADRVDALGGRGSDTGYPPDDFVALDGDEIIGRVYRIRHGTQEGLWLWSMTVSRPGLHRQGRHGGAPRRPPAGASSRPTWRCSGARAAGNRRRRAGSLPLAGARDQ
jgi:hypothetical protein